MNRIQRLTQHQAEVDPWIPDLVRQLEALLPVGYKQVVVGKGLLAALLIRDEEIATDPDGYPSGGNGGGGGSEISRPTEQAGIHFSADVDERGNVIPPPTPVVDFVHGRAEAAKRNLRESADAAKFMVGAIADAQRMITNHIGRQADRHIGSGFCRACKRPCSGALNDRLRSAYCEACYKRWKRGADAEGNRPDRAYFERLTPAWDAPPEQDTGT